MPNGTEERSGREVRLLALVIVVAVAGLLVLARFRFPGAEIVAVNPAPSPLERLASRPAFTELTDTISETAARVTPTLAVVAFEAPAERPVKGAPLAPVPPPALMPALRVRPDTVLAYAPPGLQPHTPVGTIAQVHADSQREIAWITNATLPDEHPDVADLGAAVPAFGGWSYVLSTETGVAGPTVRPVFIPRVDAVQDSRWGAPLLRIGGQPEIAGGSFLFTIDGHLIGLVVPQDRGVAIVPVNLLEQSLVEFSGDKK
jgi:hypothetical protein